jgi:hypothetical protein
MMCRRKARQSGADNDAAWSVPACHVLFLLLKALAIAAPSNIAPGAQHLQLSIDHSA